MQLFSWIYFYSILSLITRRIYYLWFCLSNNGPRDHAVIMTGLSQQLLYILPHAPRVIQSQTRLEIISGNRKMIRPF